MEDSYFFYISFSSLWNIYSMWYAAWLTNRIYENSVSGHGWHIGWHVEYTFWGWLAEVIILGNICVVQYKSMRFVVWLLFISFSNFRLHLLDFLTFIPPEIFREYKNNYCLHKTVPPGLSFELLLPVSSSENHCVCFASVYVWDLL